MKLYYAGALSLAALQGATAFSFTVDGAPPLNLKACGARTAREPVAMEAAASTPTSRAWRMHDIGPGNSLVQRIEGQTRTMRKTWKLNDIGRGCVQVAIESEGHPVHADLQLWMGLDWTPFSLKTYSEDGKRRPIKTLVGTCNIIANNQEAAMVEVASNKAVRYKDEMEFSIKSPSKIAMVPAEIPARTQGTMIAGSALHSFTIEESAKQVEIVLRTDGRQLNAKVELLELDAPNKNNPKQVYEVFTDNGDLNRLAVYFHIPEAFSTIRVVNLATVEFPCFATVNQTECQHQRQHSLA